jgi:hypothetical protein
MPRQHAAKSVLCAGPCLPGLFSVTCRPFAEHSRRHRMRPRVGRWYAKTEPIFSDAIANARRLLWPETPFERPSHRNAPAKLPPGLKAVLLDYLSQAA